MPSIAGAKFAHTVDQARVLRTICCATRRGRRLSDPVRQVHYHANLAALVAAWEAYVEGVSLECLGMMGRPIDTAYSAIHGSLLARAQTAVKKFNTPNWDNSRELLVHYTGYDPYTDWSWSRGQLNVLASKTFLNDVLQVRHSFAHGFLLPSSISWLTLAGSSYYLSAQAIDRVERFLKHLVAAADKGLALHLLSIFGVNAPW